MSSEEEDISYTDPCKYIRDATPRPISTVITIKQLVFAFDTDGRFRGAWTEDMLSARGSAVHSEKPWLELIPVRNRIYRKSTLLKSTSRI